MSTRALTEYLEAREALRRGNQSLAATVLEFAVRSPHNNRVLRENLTTLLDHRTLAGSALLELIRVEVGRRERRV